MTKTSWSAVVTALLGGVLAAIHIGKLPPALPLIRAELGIGLVGAGFLVSMFSVLGLSAGVFLGGLADRIGRPRLIVAGFGALALGGGLGAISSDLALLLAARLIEGIGFVAVAVALPAVVFAAAAPRDQAFALGMWSVYTPLGMALILLAAPLLLVPAGWRGLWLGVALLCPVMARAVLRAMRGIDPPRPSGRSLRGIVAGGLTCRGFLVIAMTFCTYALQWVTLMVWLPTFQTEAMGLSLQAATMITALIVVANVPGCLMGGGMLRRGAGARAMVVAGSLIMGGCAVGIFLPLLPDMARLGLCLAFSFFGGLIPPSLFNMVPRVAPAPELVGAGNGLLMQGSALGQFVGAPIVAHAVSSAGGDWSAALAPLLVASAITLLGGVLLPGRSAP